MELPIATVIKDSYERMPRQMKAGARWLLDHPTEVALLSMREQARRAGVPAATLTRLAKRLGFDGFDSLKEIFAGAIRERPESFAGRAEELLARREAEGDVALIGDTIEFLHGHLRELAQPSTIAALAAAADVMTDARHIFCLGLRSSFPAAYLMHYVGSLLGSSTVLVDGVGGTANDALQTVGPRDVLLAVTVSPYTRHTLQAAEFAVSRGAKLVALTDSELSPVARLAEVLIRVHTETPSFFHTMTPAFAAVECLVELIAAKRGRSALEALARNEAHLAAFDTYVLKTPRNSELLSIVTEPPIQKAPRRSRRRGT
ncbi:MurR/RpiR family transcriptional regulator [Microvirga sp. VF16]|uniref:MurR/RpiR family transcriptional regulator n=1 Tax=Microvirga sp. VF16 TaxID=2807101 RepID=UPI00193E1753|nr:MurR/RpiR family transcriptional regulator [Microvirga sp. VF16]QRM32926.1 MurR/RpiR family transcriptional regulator [Microvirga sp. VF16]